MHGAVKQSQRDLSQWSKRKHVKKSHTCQSKANETCSSSQIIHKNKSHSGFIRLCTGMNPQPMIIFKVNVVQRGFIFFSYPRALKWGIYYINVKHIKMYEKGHARETLHCFDMSLCNKEHIKRTLRQIPKSFSSVWVVIDKEGSVVL